MSRSTLHGSVIVLGAQFAGKSKLAMALAGVLKKHHMTSDTTSFVGEEYIAVINDVRIDRQLYNIEMRVHDTVGLLEYYDMNLEIAKKADVVVVVVNPLQKNHYEPCQKFIQALRLQNIPSTQRSIFVVVTHNDEFEEKDSVMRNLHHLATSTQCEFFRTSAQEYADKHYDRSGIELLRNKLGGELVAFDLLRTSSHCCNLM